MMDGGNADAGGRRPRGGRAFGLVARDETVILPPVMNPGNPVSAAERSDAWYTRGAAILIAVLWAVHFALSATLELAGDEAYYWVWSRHLDYGYYSKGPGIAWIIRAGTAILGDTEAGVRLFAGLFSVGSNLLLFDLARRMFGARTGFWTVVVAATIPMFIAGSMLMTIDPASVFCWLAAAWFAWRAGQDRRAWGWAAAGLCIAAGLLCKFTNAAQLISFAIYAAWAAAPRAGRPVRGVATAIALAALGLVPVVLWNMQHGWITFQHLQHRGALDEPFHFHFGELLGFLGSQAGAFSPLYFAGLLWAVGRRDWNGPQADAHRFLVAHIAPLVLGYSVLSLNGEWEANWTAPALATAPLLLTGSWLAAIRRRPFLRRWAVAAVGVGVAVTALLHAVVATPWAFGHGRFRRIGGAENLARAHVAPAMKETGASFVIGGNYQLASLMAFYVPGHPDVFLPDRGVVENQFSFWPSYLDRTNATAIHVDKWPDPPKSDPTRTTAPVLPSELRKQFTAVEMAGDVWTAYRGRTMRHYALHICRTLRPPPPR